MTTREETARKLMARQKEYIRKGQDELKKRVANISIREKRNG